MGLPPRDNLVNDRLGAKVIESVATAFVCLQLRVRGVDVSGRLKAEGKEGATLVSRQPYPVIHNSRKVSSITTEAKKAT